MSIRRRTLYLAGLLGCAVALVGCVGPGVGPGGGPRPASPGPTSTSTPTAAAFVLPGPPTQVLDLTCADLVPAGDLTTMFGARGYRPRTDTAWLVSPREFAVPSRGGLACLWGNDVPERTGGGFANAGSDLVQVTVLPGVTAAEWARYGGLYPQDAPAAAFGDRSGTGCFAGNSPAPACSMNVLVGDVWLEILAYGIDLGAGATDADLLSRMSPVVDRLVERVGAARVIARQAPPPVDVPTCRSLLPRAWEHPAGGWSLVSSAAAQAGALTCLPTDVGTRGVAAARLDLLPGGAWAFADTVAETGVALNAAPVTVAGTSVPESYLRCPVPGSPTDEEAFSGCSVDLAVGADWLRVSLPVDDRNPWYVGMAGQLLKLAAEVVQNAVTATGR